MPGAYSGLSRAAARRLRRWRLWEDLPVSAVTYVLSLEIFAIAVSVFSAINETTKPGDVALMAFLACGYNLYCLLVVRVERARYRAMASVGGHRFSSDMFGLWIFPAALLLPLWMAAVVAVLGSAVRFTSVYRQTRAPYYRPVLAVATVVVACAATRILREVFDLTFDPAQFAGTSIAVIAILLVVHSLTNFSAIAAAVILSSGRGAVRIVPSQHALDLASLSFGALLACLLAFQMPWVGTLAIPVILVMQTANSTGRIRSMASIDSSTGVGNAASWQLAAQRELRQCLGNGQTVGLLVIEIGGLDVPVSGGDNLDRERVMAAIGGRILATAGKGRLIGRVYDDEFAILSPAADLQDLHRLENAVAEEIGVVEMATGRHPAGCREDGVLAARIGVAMSPRDGVRLQDVLIAAETSIRCSDDVATVRFGVLARHGPRPIAPGDHDRGSR